MAAIKNRDTKPEMRVRSVLYALGYKYRLHRKDLPGKPDIVLPKYHTVIFVHGCFWHCHDCRWGRVIPKTREAFWRNKRGGNVARDKMHRADLRTLGWKVVTIWECQTRSDDAIRVLLTSKLAVRT